MEALKEIFNKKSIKTIGMAISRQSSSFEYKEFCRLSAEDLNNLELKQRVNQIAKALNASLPNSFESNTEILTGALAPVEEHLDYEWNSSSANGLSGFLVWPLTTYIELFGLDQKEASYRAMYEMTQRFSSEFVMRAFLNQDCKNAFQILRKWKKDPSHHVRRLVSEATRPNLPWGTKVPSVNENLDRNIKLIYSLRKDSSLYVRRSVANHLNDISRLDAALFIKTIDRFGNSDEEIYVKRHASRSLLKAGHPKVLEFHGYLPPAKKTKCELRLNKQKVKIGGELTLDLSLTSPIKQKVLIEFGVHYLKANGTHSLKNFRFKDTFLEKDIINFSKKFSFKNLTTRKHYPGVHFIQIQINGKVFSKIPFTLLK